jgi:hypothetical protein
VADRVAAVAPNGVDAILDLVGGDALYAVAGLAADKSTIITAVDPTTAAELGGGYFQVIQNGEALSALAEPRRIRRARTPRHKGRAVR